MLSTKVIRMVCCAFLWWGDVNDARCANVSWTDVCLPKREDGMSIKHLESCNTSYLKNLWLILTKMGLYGMCGLSRV